MFVRNAWYVAAWCHEVAEDGVLARTIINQPLVLYRTAQRHGGRDGGPLLPPPRAAVQGPARGRRSALHVSRPEVRPRRPLHRNSRADDDPRHAPWCAAIRWWSVAVGCGSGWATLRARTCRKFRRRSPPPIRRGGSRPAAWTTPRTYQLINDNLLDLSHLELRAREDAGAEHAAMGKRAPERHPAAARRAVPALVPQSRRRRTTTASRATTIRPLAFLRFPGAGHVPAEAGLVSARHGAAAATCSHRPSRPLFVRLDEQAVTPMSETTSRYFYATGARSADADAALVDEMFRFTEIAFHEDKAIIEAQQKVIALDPAGRCCRWRSTPGRTCSAASCGNCSPPRHPSRTSSCRGAGRLTPGETDDCDRRKPCLPMTQPGR